MDEYGTFENTELDAKTIREKIEQASVVFAWSHNKIDAYIFTIVKDFNVVGVMPFGGSPRQRIYVGLYGKGCNHFSTNDIHAGYWEEKLNLDSGGAESWANFWNMIWDPSK
jgi:hypothetical protein